MIQKEEPVPDPLTLSRRGGYTMVIPLNECFIVQRSLQDKKAQLCENRLHLGAARIKQHKNVFRKRRSFGYAVSPFCRSISKDAGSIPTRS